NACRGGVRVSCYRFKTVHLRLQLELLRLRERAPKSPQCLFAVFGLIPRGAEQEIGFGIAHHVSEPRSNRCTGFLADAVTLPESVADASRAENGCEPVAQHCDLHHEFVRQVLVLLNLKAARDGNELPLLILLQGELLLRAKAGRDMHAGAQQILDELAMPLFWLLPARELALHI